MRDPGTKRLGPLPSANGAITRLACARAKEAGVDLELLLKKAALTLRQLEDPNVRLRVRDQITTLLSYLIFGKLDCFIMSRHLRKC
jgi:hypothetical protein